MRAPLALLCCCCCLMAAALADDTVLYGTEHSGGTYADGQLMYNETFYSLACAPSSKYSATIAALEGNILAAVDSTYSYSYCDACIKVTDPGTSVSIVARVVSYGDFATSTGSSSSVTLSAEALAALGSTGSDAKWQLCSCADTGAIRYEFKNTSSIYWTSLWVRNQRCQVTKVEVISKAHTSFTALVQGSDGSWTDSTGFQSAYFTIRVTGVNGVSINDTFTTFSPSSILTGSSNLIASSSTTVSSAADPVVVVSSTPTAEESSAADPVVAESSTADPVVVESSTADPVVVVSSTADPVVVVSSTPTAEESSTPAAEESSTPAAEESSTPAAEESSTPVATESSTPVAVESSAKDTGAAPAKTLSVAAVSFLLSTLVRL